jgi:replicative DNA helicase
VVDHAERIDQALATLESLADRLAFVSPPVDLVKVAGSADAFEADLLLLDYIQRIAPPGNHADKRGSVTATMAYLREFAEVGKAVVVVSAVGRTKDTRGRSSYDSAGLSLASFRETSELEYGCDDAFLLVADGKVGDAVTLRHLKSRYAEARDLKLSFDRKLQRFAAVIDPQSRPDSSTIPKNLAALWDRTPPASDIEGCDE